MGADEPPSLSRNVVSALFGHCSRWYLAEPGLQPFVVERQLVVEDAAAVPAVVAAAADGGEGCSPSHLEELVVALPCVAVAAYGVVFFCPTPAIG